MQVMKIIMIVIFIVVCVALSGIILLQEGKSAGLGSIAGMGESYWSKAKGRSVEGTLDKITTILAILFLIMALVLNIVW
ncbi:MAG: preprotein translocase subunit SecG [Eubacteriales bacterium]|nr:preprotein translocase subunit SecG [Eubacteriales bacterium]